MTVSAASDFDRVVWKPFDSIEGLSVLHAQVEEVRAIKEELLHQTRLTVEQKLQRAEEKRLLHLKETAQKAHEERAKVCV